ncbi:CMGC/SRPK protein kinase [Rickenella mellea]|uniref:CMGC/SRPK protein kinase n=1 Tax=Rickenella mellea TaxID=50990 RepID=A0A4Y7PYL1_9AGAM|nr:CMGC/SRPK protein kinase [Rickenella mellea]
MLRTLFRRAWKPLRFSNQDFVRIPAHQKVEEETIPDYVATRYYPVRIGDIFQDRYQVVGKLGYGASSTVWLARDLSYRRHVALKLFIHSKSMGSQLDNELNMYKRIEKATKRRPRHSGRSAVRSLLDSFDVDGPDGQHRCLVHRPLWDSVHTFLHRNPVRRLPPLVLSLVLERLFLALDFLHTECRVAHTDIQANNIMFDMADDSVFSDFEEEELRNPCPRKELYGRTIYLSRELRMPKNVCAPVLCDFGSAVLLDDETEHRELIQPKVYRVPEVILEAPWTYSVDIWNAGCMIWDVFEGGNLFNGKDPEHAKYRSRAHLAEMVALLGPPPPSLLAKGNLTSKFFSDAGDFCAGIPLPERTSLEDRETTLEGEDRACFLRLVRKMLQWEPDKRSSARELVTDEWLSKH